MPCKPILFDLLSQFCQYYLTNRHTKQLIKSDMSSIGDNQIDVEYKIFYYYFWMDKGQVKPRKDKKKNTETGLLMGQNTNIFSQLSATYLQNKTSNTEEENNFVKSTQIIQYHDPTINRLIALLRKKADVTKVKAATELREQFEKMNQQNLEEFMPTFAQLFLEVVVNQQSKQVVDEFIIMTNNLFTNNKKLAIKQISTFYGPLLIINRPSNNSSLKVYNLLFNGTQQQLHEKALTLLLMKKQVMKKFIVFCRNIIECEETHRFGQQNFQRNCAALMKVLKDFVFGYEIIGENLQKNNNQKKVKQLSNSLSDFIAELDEIINSKSIEEYFKNGGKGKAAILQMYITMIKASVRHPQWKIQWEKYGKTLCQNFLDKDSIVQQFLWKYCNKQFIECCLQIQKQMEKQPYSLYIKYLPKPEQKLLQALKVGGFHMYRELCGYCEVFPLTSFSKFQQTHKSLVNKVNYIRKLMNTILNDLQDENQARIQCYYSLTKHFISSFRSIKYDSIDEKKMHEITQMITKCEKQLIQNLQYKYYSNPPVSRNSFTYNIPSYFCKLLEELHPNYQFDFNATHTFALYKQLKTDTEHNQAIFDRIYENCKNNNKLLLQYLQNFPSKNIYIDLSEGGDQPEIIAHIFLLSKQAHNEENWFVEEWDERIRVIVYDPRITQQDLTAYEEMVHQNHNNLYFSPINKVLPKMFDNPEYDQRRIKYFLKCLSHKDNSSQMIPLFLPMIKDKLMQRNNQKLTQQLLKIFQTSQQQLKNKKWIIGVDEVKKIRIVVDVVIDTLVSVLNSQQSLKIYEENGVVGFLESLCLFALALHNYKLELDAEEILKKVNMLTYVYQENISNALLFSVRESIKQCYRLFNNSSKKSNIQEKQRRNRLDRCLQFIRKVIWFGMGRNMRLVNQNLTYIFEDLMLEDGWREAHHKSDLWQILQLIMVNTTEEKVGESLISNLVKQNIETNKYSKFISFLLCCQLLLSLQRHPTTKTLFTQFQTKMLNYIENNTNDQQKLTIFKMLMDQAVNDQSLTVMHGAKNLLKTIMKNYQKLDQQTLEKFAEECLREPLNKIDQQNYDIQRTTLLVINLCTELPLLDIPKTEEFVDILLDRYVKLDEKEYLSYTAILASIWEAGAGVDKLTEQAITEIIKKTLGIYVSNCKKGQAGMNFSKLCIFTLFNSLINLRGVGLFETYSSQILQFLIRPKIHADSSLHGAVQLARLKYISKTFDTLNQQVKNQLMNEIPKQILTDINLYKTLLDQIEEDEGQQMESNQKYENVIGMFIESAEVLIKFASHLSSEVYPNQSVILGLLSCQFAGVKRTSFILLKQMYELQIVERLPPKQFLSELTIDHKIFKQQLNASITNELSKYLHAWQAIIYRRTATQKPGASEQQYQLTLEEYLQQQIQGTSPPQLYYENFLKSIFEILGSQLDYTQNEEQYSEMLSISQLIAGDMIIIIEDELNMKKKLYRLTVKTLFLFILNFPLFLKDFIDKNKKHKNICDKILRNIISDAIFQEQIARIEIREPEWRSSGNFDIYVTPKNKEIYAEYTHDVIRIGLRLMMKNNFPMTPITIQFGEGLKLDEGSRWALMLQSQLHNRNNTIINGILLWKQNIDKKLAGVQQCAICFDIVTSSGQLPKKGCKTCKKKFHSHCVMKWFNKSHKSECPLCKSQFL